MLVAGRHCPVLLAVGWCLFVVTSCATTALNMRAVTKQASALGVACNQSALRFAASPAAEARQDALRRLKELNDTLIETAEYEREARRVNSVELIDANRAFLEAGRAWGDCSLKYNKVLVAIGEHQAARRNYEGVFARLTGPQFAAERRQIQAALAELDR